MKILFVHRNFPAQFIHLAALLGNDIRNEVVFLTERESGSIPGVEKVLYKVNKNGVSQGHPLLYDFEEAVTTGQGVAYEALKLRSQGFVPDVIIGHSGWGPLLFLKDVFPQAKIIGMFEWFYNAYGSDVEFIQKQVSPETEVRIRMKNSTILEELAMCDAGYCPTYWQHSQFPNEYAEKLRIIHDGIDVSVCAPRSGVKLKIPQISLDLSRVSEIITYVGRGLEPYRGFPEFMKAMELVLKQRPDVHVIIVGNQEEVFYGTKRKDGRSYKEAILELVDIDLDRVHFTGHLPKPLYLQVLQVSKVHVYLTVPFVLSWSMLEAMSCGCKVVASATKPVMEVINDGINGFLTDFQSPKKLAGDIIKVLQSPNAYKGVSYRARHTILERYELNSMLRKQLQFFQEVMG